MRGNGTRERERVREENGSGKDCFDSEYEGLEVYNGEVECSGRGRGFSRTLKHFDNQKETPLTI